MALFESEWFVPLALGVAIAIAAMVVEHYRSRRRDERWGAERLMVLAPEAERLRRWWLHWVCALSPKVRAIVAVAIILGRIAMAGILCLALILNWPGVLTLGFLIFAIMSVITGQAPSLVFYDHGFVGSTRTFIPWADVRTVQWETDPRTKSAAIVIRCTDSIHKARLSTEQQGEVARTLRSRGIDILRARAISHANQVA